MNGTAKARSTDKRYYGVSEAVVVDINDPEKEGRVKVKFPWFDPTMISDWCRVAQLYAGGGYGSFWVPEVNDEVLVGFVQGDMRFPVILGGLYNGVDKPATSRSDGANEPEINQKIFRTSGGHELLFDDTSGKEKIVLTSVGGHSATLDDTAGQVIVTTAAGQSVTLDDTGAVTIKGSASVTIDAPQIKLGAAAAEALVKGATFLGLFNAHTHNCTAPGTPSGPPVPPLTPAVLSTVTKTA
ncbi:MAG: phage baseplate assembly protein V [Bryobacteraceae bacterium]